jgi:hypothetical protein
MHLVAIVPCYQDRKSCRIVPSFLLLTRLLCGRVLGTFQNTTGATDCFSCAPGKFAAIAGQAICQQCPGPMADPNDISIFSLDDHTGCAATCDSGFYHTTELECARCPLCADNKENAERCPPDDCRNSSKCWNFTSNKGANLNISACFVMTPVVLDTPPPQEG